MDTDIVVVDQDLLDDTPTPVVLPGPSSSADLGRLIFTTVKTKLYQAAHQSYREVRLDRGHQDDRHG